MQTEFISCLMCRIQDLDLCKSSNQMARSQQPVTETQGWVEEKMSSQWCYWLLWGKKSFSKQSLPRHRILFFKGLQSLVCMHSQCQNHIPWFKCFWTECALWTKCRSSYHEPWLIWMKLSITLVGGSNSLLTESKQPLVSNQTPQRNEDFVKDSRTSI